MKTFFFHLCVVMLLSSCSSSKLVNEWKSPDTPTFEANKVLVVGMSADIDLRRTFENEVMKSLEKNGVVAVRSVDFFEQSFTDVKRTEEELNRIENQLLDAGFDAILFAKVTGQESRVTLVQSYRNFSKPYESFRDYYYSNQDIYQKEQKEQYQVYNTETSLYCICPGKERELLWKGAIDIVDAERMSKNIDSYVKILLQSLKEEQLLIVDI